MKRAIMAALVLLAAAAASAADFDIDSYCHMVSKEASDRHAAEKECRAQEERDQQKLSGMTIPGSIASHCTEVAQGVGGSYQTMHACVKQELANQKQADE